MSCFKWTRVRENAALLLSQAETQQVVARELGISDRTIRRWLNDIEFSAEVDRLTLLLGISSKAARLRIAMRAINQKTTGKILKTERDLLDWLKYAQSETDGANFNLSAVFAAMEAETADSSENAEASGEDDTVA